MYQLDRIRRNIKHDSQTAKAEISSGVYTTADIARILGVSTATARKLIHEENLSTVPYTKNILVPIGVFNEWHLHRFGAPVTMLSA